MRRKTKFSSYRLIGINQPKLIAVPVDARSTHIRSVIGIPGAADSPSPRRSAACTSCRSRRDTFHYDRWTHRVSRLSRFFTRAGRHASTARSRKSIVRLVMIWGSSASMRDVAILRQQSGSCIKLATLEVVA
jgi:hypothetical protein